MTDAQWRILEPMLRLPTKPMAKGRQRRDLRLMAEAAFFILRTDAPWRDWPIKYGPWQTAYHYFNRWSHAEQLAQAHLQLVALLHEVGLVNPGTMHIDATHCCLQGCCGGLSDFKTANCLSLRTTTWDMDPRAGTPRST